MNRFIVVKIGTKLTIKDNINNKYIFEELDTRLNRRLFNKKCARYNKKYIDKSVSMK